MKAIPRPDQFWRERDEDPLANLVSRIPPERSNHVRAALIIKFSQRRERSGGLHTDDVFSIRK